MHRLQPPHTTCQDLRWEIFWATVLAALGTFDAWRDTKHDGSTLSEVTRVVFDTEHPAGRVLFLTTLTAGGAVLAAHILKR